MLCGVVPAVGRVRVSGKGAPSEGADENAGALFAHPCLHFTPKWSDSKCRGFGWGVGGAVTHHITLPGTARACNGSVIRTNNHWLTDMSFMNLSNLLVAPTTSCDNCALCREVLLVDCPQFPVNQFPWMIPDANIVRGEANLSYWCKELWSPLHQSPIFPLPCGPVIKKKTRSLLCEINSHGLWEHKWLLRPSLDFCERQISPTSRFTNL